ncbi:hypothetical protein C1645_731740 [Glomus cerebriforme]|uniref:BTB domain-containing protein n=1 Tax=Glomus cerebriforme TaxID=658196 RepID=A0A397TPE3_9GLOM|nr:hypothetical protein C1645_731740 [Glomus cerebriforme]
MEVNSKCSIEDPESAVFNNDSDLLSSVSLGDKHYGLFNDKYPLHVIPHPEKHNIYMNRVSYDTQSDSYYENGIIDKKYIEFWDKGVFFYENLIQKTIFSYDRINLKDVTALFPEHQNHTSSIIYKFDYSTYKNLEISSFDLKINCFDKNANNNWIFYISTNSTNNYLDATSDLKNRKWEKIKEMTENDENNYVRMNLENFIRNKKIFYIQAEIGYGDIQLFSRTKHFHDKLENNIGENFELDIIVEFSPLTLLKKVLNLCVKPRSKIPNLNETIEKSFAKSNKSIYGGLFNDKYRCNVLPIEEKENIYTHRISYSNIKNAYYENGISHIKYLKKWDRGAFTYNNLYYFPEYSLKKRRTHVSRTLSHDKRNNPAYITWKFDYRLGNFYLSSLKLELKFFNLSDRENIKWSIQLLPTRKNPDPEFKPIMFPEIFYLKNYTIDLTEMVKDEYGFILKAYLAENHHLFKQYESDYDIDSNENFSMDIKVELKPNIICDLIQEKMKCIENNEKINENLSFNDKNTSDFIIKLELSGEDYCEDITEGIFYMHMKVLSSGSDYFQALLNSHMLESQNRCLKLTDISYFILEKILLFIYTNNIENINELEDWIDLLYAASRFLLSKLIQVCELSIRKLVNFDNVKDIEIVAHECCSMQLIKYCEMFEIKNNEQGEDDIHEKENKPISIVKKSKSTQKTYMKKKSKKKIAHIKPIKLLNQV